MGPFPDAPTKSFEITACPTECTACTSADNCQSCADDYFLDGGACESVKDCLATEYETAGPTPTSDRECAALTECDLATDYESVAPTPTSDRQCSLKICTCAKGSHATGADCDENGIVTCTDCDALDHYLDGTPGQEDCFSCPTECTECDAADNCQSCIADYFLEMGQCKPVKTCLETEYETVAPTTTSDRDCAACTVASDCGDGTFLDGICEGTSNPTCMACPMYCATCSSSVSCDTCEAGSFLDSTDNLCKALRVCDSTEYESVAPGCSDDGAEEEFTYALGEIGSPDCPAGYER